MDFATYITYGAGALLILLGISFAYKCVQAIFWGRITYWKGFLPFTIVSPLLVHFVSLKKPNTLLRSANYWWVHVTLGPIFFLLALATLASGADLLGLPGSESVNYILKLGRNDVPSAILYSKEHGYQFPVIERIQKRFMTIMSAPVGDKKDDQN